MAFLELTGVQKRFGPTFAVEDFNLADRARRVRQLPRPVGLRQDDDPPDDRRVRDADRRHDHARRPRHHPPAAEQAQRRDGLPVLRPLPEHDRGRQHRLRAARPEAAEGPDPQAGRRAPRADQPARQGRPLPVPAVGRPAAAVALARALAIEPEVLLLDEPLSALDAKIRVALRKEIRSIQRQLGITTVYVTHDQEEALSLSDRVVVMSEGRIEQIGPPPEIYNFPATPFVASFVGTLNLLAGDGRRRRGRAACQHRRPGDPRRAAIRRRDGPARHGRAPARGDRARRGRRGNRLRGDVEDVSFLGSIVRTRVQVGRTATRPSRSTSSTTRA